MPRSVKARVSYHADAAFLARLSIAVEKDEKLTKEKKKEIISHLTAANVLLLQAGVEEPKKESKSK